MQSFCIVFFVHIALFSINTEIRCTATTNAKHRVQRFIFPSNTALSFKTDLKIPLSLPGGSSGSFDVSMPLNIPLLRYGSGSGRRKDVNRFNLFSLFRNIIEKLLSRTESCLLRSICEISEKPIDDNSLISDAFISLLRSLYISYKISGMQKYMKAQSVGKTIGNCSKHYTSCRWSLI